jgi:hypothetical protein
MIKVSNLAVNYSDSHLHHCQFHRCTPSPGEYCSQDQPSRLNTRNDIHHPQVRRYHADYMHSYTQLPTQQSDMSVCLCERYTEANYTQV